MCSISSAGSSNGSPHHQLNSQNNHHHHPHHQFLNNKSSGGLVKPPNPLRLSSVSSQDSGFTSQDTLFLRPGSPKRLLPASNSSVVDGSERPHTISTAYEKGHQRPQLQPYTFSPPESTLTIHECDQDENGAALTGNGSLNGSEVNNGNGRNSSCGGDQPPSRSGSSLGKKPPVPQRIGQLSQDHQRPMLPSKTMAATMAAAKQQQLQMLQQHQQQQQGSRQLPSFTADKNDMGKCHSVKFSESFSQC